MKKYAKPYKIISIVISIIVCIALSLSLLAATIISGAKMYLISDKFDAQIESADLSSLTFIYNGEKITLERYVKEYVSNEIEDYIRNNPFSDFTDLLYPFAGTITDYAIDQVLSSNYVNKAVKTQVHSIAEYFISGDVEKAKERIENGITLETNPELNSDNASSFEEKVNIEVKKAVFQYIEAESGTTCDRIIVLMSSEMVDTLMTICEILAILLLLINIPFAWRSLVYLGVTANVYSAMLYFVVHNFNEKYKEMSDLVSYQFLKPIVDNYLPYGEKASFYGAIILLGAVAIFICIPIINLFFFSFAPGIISASFPRRKSTDITCSPYDRKT